MTLDLSEEEKRPYFFWDEDLSIRELKSVLRSEDREARLYYAAKVMREARYEDVWRFLSLRDAWECWSVMGSRLGRQTGFWAFLMSVWKRHGIVP
jgi:hypothetical protein